MAEQTNISWADATLARIGVIPEINFMCSHMTDAAQRYAILQVEPMRLKFGERQEMVSVQIPATVVATANASELVTGKHVISPPLELAGQTLATPFYAATIYIARGIRPPWSSLARSLANFHSRFEGMFFPYPITRPCLRRRAHLRAAFCGHHRAFSNHVWSL